MRIAVCADEQNYEADSLFFSLSLYIRNVLCFGVLEWFEQWKEISVNEIHWHFGINSEIASMRSYCSIRLYPPIEELIVQPADFERKNKCTRPTRHFMSSK